MTMPLYPCLQSNRSRPRLRGSPFLYGVLAICCAGWLAVAENCQAEDQIQDFALRDFVCPQRPFVFHQTTSSPAADMPT